MKDADKLLDTIKAQRVTQKPRWQFTLKNILYWSGYILFIILGSMAFSIILFAAKEGDFDLLSYNPSSTFTLLLKLLPIFWIICTGLCIAVSLFGIRHTKIGYRYSLLFVMGSSVFLSVLIGTLFYFTGGAERLEQLFASNVGIYQSILEKKISFWSMPEKGFLSGKIITKGDTITIKDFTGKIWDIDYIDAFIRSRTLLEEGNTIKIIGKIVDDSRFLAEEIRSWEGRGMQRNQRNNNL